MTESQIGTDELISLVDGWGPDDPHVPLHLDEWKESNFDPPIGLLLGGVGDGKHFLWFLLRARIFWLPMCCRLALYFCHPITSFFIRSEFVPARVHPPPCCKCVIEHDFDRPCRSMPAHPPRSSGDALC